MYHQLINKQVKAGKDGWVRCSNCGHKLGKVLLATTEGNCIVEIKCHSCKALNIINFRKETEL